MTQSNERRDRANALKALSLTMIAGVGSATFVHAARGAETAVKEALATFKRAYASKEESERVRAIADLGSTQHKTVAEALTTPLLKDRSSAVRRAAASTLGQQWAPVAVPALAKALELEGDHSVELAIIDALGDTGSDAAVPVLVQRLVPKRRGASTPGEGEEEPSADTGPALAALKKIGSSSAIEDLLVFLSKDAALRAKRRGSSPPGPLARQAEETLQALTGEKLNGVTEWRRWWNAAKDSLKTVLVYRCQETGRPFIRGTAATKCPHCSDRGKACETFLRTQLERVSTEGDRR